MTAWLLEGIELPANAKVVDYLAYDAILPHADAFITNGGMEGFCRVPCRRFP
ncbi:hypothetical protein BDV12DRAFT_165387 [Aspergillus spectabilis]